MRREYSGWRNQCRDIIIVNYGDLSERTKTKPECEEGFNQIKREEGMTVEGGRLKQMNWNTFPDSKAVNACNWFLINVFAVAKLRHKTEQK